jgi:hypothetical protein
VRVCVCVFTSLLHVYVDDFMSLDNIQNKQTPWSLSASELYRPSDRCMSAKLVPTFADRGCRVVSATDPQGSILVFQTGTATLSSK